jgi:glucosamine--fructose-6-phosphate aminotransferase (isomerizing)
MPRGGVAIFVSQSGETADTLAALRYAKAERQHVLAIVNQLESSIAREADIVLPTLAGPEIGVVSTKAFTTPLAVLAAFTAAVARARDVLYLGRGSAFPLALEGALKLKEISYIRAEGLCRRQDPAR